MRPRRAIKGEPNGWKKKKCDGRHKGYRGESGGVLAVRAKIYICFFCTTTFVKSIKTNTNKHYVCRILLMTNICTLVSSFERLWLYLSVFDVY